ncbi:hypothetical protein V9T40_007052 [Parthenolecanium corni]|uniref:RING-type domain-containing protein n=1 Tax=Parthenolecanium corni TaxID=536013 RepID=A0AAN9YBA0_9HEMI
MNPAIVSAAVVVVGIIAAALYQTFSEAPPTHNHHSNRRRTAGDNVYNYNYTSFNTNNYYPPDESITENESRNRKKQRRKLTVKNSECGICLEELTGRLEVLPCDHAYHAVCLEKYSESENKSNGEKLKCPLCRQEID